MSCNRFPNKEYQVQLRIILNVTFGTLSEKKIATLDLPHQVPTPMMSKLQLKGYIYFQLWILKIQPVWYSLSFSNFDELGKGLSWICIVVELPTARNQNVLLPEVQRSI